MKNKIYYKKIKIFKNNCNGKDKEDNNLQWISHLRNNQMMKYLLKKVVCIMHNNSIPPLEWTAYYWQKDIISVHLSKLKMENWLKFIKAQKMDFKSH